MLTPTQRRALAAMDKAPDTLLYATNKAQTDANLNATVARALLDNGYIQEAPSWLAQKGTGHGVPYILTDAGYEEVA